MRRWDKDNSRAEIPSYPKVPTPESNLSTILRGPNRRSFMCAHANTHAGSRARAAATLARVVWPGGS